MTLTDGVIKLRPYVRVVVRWETTVDTRMGQSSYKQRRTFRGDDARVLADHFKTHVVMAQDPEWVTVEVTKEESR